MKTWRALGVCLLAMSSRPALASDIEWQQEPVEPLRAAELAAQRKDCGSALDIVAQQTSAANFESLPSKVRLDFYQVGMACAASAERLELARRYADIGTKVPGAPAIFWQARVKFAWAAKQSAEAVAALEDMARECPEGLNAIPATSWNGAERTLKSDPQLRQRLLKVLASPSYTPRQVGDSTDYFREEYAVSLADAGDSKGAAAAISLIDDPRYLMRISIDPRFRAIFPEHFDARAAVERHLVHMRELAAAHRNMLRPQLNVANDFIMLGQGEQALALLQSLHPDEPGQDGFADRANQLNWWWNSKARAYTLLGRYDEAARAYTEGKSLLESGKPNISQTINLSELQLRFGHPADALVTLEPVSAGRVPASPFGWMQYYRAHGCANFRVGRIEVANADLAYMREHVADSPGALTGLLLCMGDLNGAAALVIQRLRTPDERVQALLDLSDYAPPPPTYPKDPVELQYEVLRSRDDVRAAALQAGGIRKFNVPH